MVCVSLGGLIRCSGWASNKAFWHVETLFVQGNLYLAGLLLVIQGLFTFRQPIASLLGTDFYLNE